MHLLMFMSARAQMEVSYLKRQISVTIDEGVLEWMDEVIQEHVEYRSRSHVCEIALVRFRASISQKPLT